MTSTFTTTNAANLNTVLHGDCVEITCVRTVIPDRFRPKGRGGKGSRRPHLCCYNDDHEIV
jgi:hypothetical protein